MFVFKHPKYYTELRKRNKSDQVIGRGDSTEAGRRAPDPNLKLQASSSKRQAVPLWKPGLRVKNRFNRKVKMKLKIYEAGEQLNRIANALEEILRLVKEDQERS